MPNYDSYNTNEMARQKDLVLAPNEFCFVQNKTSGAMRMFWVYGPDNQEITIIGLEPHPEDKKNGAYDRIVLSDLE